MSRHESGLKGRGHEIEIAEEVAGGMNGVQFDHEAGLIRGAACRRSNGSPAGISGGHARIGGRSMFGV